MLHAWLPCVVGLLSLSLTAAQPTLSGYPENGDPLDAFVVEHEGVYFSENAVFVLSYALCSESSVCFFELHNTFNTSDVREVSTTSQTVEIVYTHTVLGEGSFKSRVQINETVSPWSTAITLDVRPRPLGAFSMTPSPAQTLLQAGAVVKLEANFTSGGSKPVKVDFYYNSEEIANFVTRGYIQEVGPSSTSHDVTLCVWTVCSLNGNLPFNHTIVMSLENEEEGVNSYAAVFMVYPTPVASVALSLPESTVGSSVVVSGAVSGTRTPYTLSFSLVSATGSFPIATSTATSHEVVLSTSHLTGERTTLLTPTLSAVDGVGATTLVDGVCTQCLKLNHVAVPTLSTIPAVTVGATFHVFSTVDGGTFLYEDTVPPIYNWSLVDVSNGNVVARVVGSSASQAFVIEEAQLPLDSTALGRGALILRAHLILTDTVNITSPEVAAAEVVVINPRSQDGTASISTEETTVTASTTLVTANLVGGTPPFTYTWTLLRPIDPSQTSPPADASVLEVADAHTVTSSGAVSTQYSFPPEALHAGATTVFYVALSVIDSAGIVMVGGLPYQYIYPTSTVVHPAPVASAALPASDVGYGPLNMNITAASDGGTGNVTARVSLLDPSSGAVVYVVQTLQLTPGSTVLCECYVPEDVLGNQTAADFVVDVVVYDAVGVTALPLTIENVTIRERPKPSFVALAQSAFILGDNVPLTVTIRNGTSPFNGQVYLTRMPGDHAVLVANWSDSLVRSVDLSFVVEESHITGSGEVWHAASTIVSDARGIASLVTVGPNVSLAWPAPSLTVVFSELTGGEAVVGVPISIDATVAGLTGPFRVVLHVALADGSWTSEVHTCGNVSETCSVPFTFEALHLLEGNLYRPHATVIDVHDRTYNATGSTITVFQSEPPPTPQGFLQTAPPVEDDGINVVALVLGLLAGCCCCIIILILILFLLRRRQENEKIKNGEGKEMIETIPSPINASALPGLAEVATGAMAAKKAREEQDLSHEASQEEAAAGGMAGAHAGKAAGGQASLSSSLGRIDGGRSMLWGSAISALPAIARQGRQEQAAREEDEEREAEASAQEESAGEEESYPD